jgi:N-acetylglutamate synthase-like GNAT family acetyltransferase
VTGKIARIIPPKISKTNMDCSLIQFCADKTEIDIEKIQELFKVGAFWAQNRRREDLEIAIENSDPVITIWDDRKTIGFARATSDCIYRATIWDVVIHPDYRGCGLGRKLVETVLTHPRVNRVERVYLMTTHQQKFYERIGFKANTSTTMILNNETLSYSSLLLERSSEDPTNAFVTSSFG